MSEFAAGQCMFPFHALVVISQVFTHLKSSISVLFSSSITTSIVFLNNIKFPNLFSAFILLLFFVALYEKIFPLVHLNHLILPLVQSPNINTDVTRLLPYN